MNINEKCVNTIRVISAEGITNANSGHPGICLGAAPIAYQLFSEMKINGANPTWENRDRFILSAGHGSMMLYTLLHLFGYPISREELKTFRKFKSKLPGHPELGITEGVDMSTGPLGQGIANAVGFALAENYLSAKFNKPEFPVVDHYTYALCGEGCLEEGISYEACSFAGTQKLGKLILIYDKNDISIEGSVKTAFSEDVEKRFEMQGWQVLTVEDANDLQEISNALKLAREEGEKPSIIICKSKIGYASLYENSAKIHGTPLKWDEVEALKQNLNYSQAPFEVASEVEEHFAKLNKEKEKKEEEWKTLLEKYASTYPKEYNEYKAFMSGKCANIEQIEGIFDFTKPEATRISGGKVINKIAKHVPNLLSGSADLAPSTKTDIVGEDYFSPENRLGRNIHFGIREHAMGAICNGIAAHGGLRVICSTFFVFSDYVKGAIRMSALMNLPVIYVFTHDSIGVGEDGPTHEPIEQLAALRVTPNINVFRPCDGKETVYAFESALKETKPTAIILSRQNLAQQSNSGTDALKGGYVLSANENAKVVLVATGSEVEVCMQAQKQLAEENIQTAVVSMPCMEIFEAQSEEYKNSVIPADRKVVCVETGSSMPWYKYAKDGAVIGIDCFGESGAAELLFEHFGFTAENVKKIAKKVMQ